MARYHDPEKALPPMIRSVVPSFLQRVFARRQKIEAFQSISRPPPHASQNPAPMTRPQLISYTSHGPIQVQDKLNTYRRITGITSAEDHEADFRPARNLGIYARVVRNERHASDAFKFSSRLINGCLGLQLVVAAALTALGAGNGPHGLVTAFGAINTVIAGFLTYLKGSGLPNRHKFYASSWSKVREYMEQREREFERSDCQLDVEEVIKKVEEMYEEVRQDVEANEPEAYTSTGQIKRSDGLTPGPRIADKTRESSLHPYGNKVFPAIGATASGVGSNHISQAFDGDWKSGFDGSRTAVSGGDRFSGLAEKMHSFGGDKLLDALTHRKADGNGISQISDIEPLREVDQKFRRAMDASAENMRSAQHMEAKAEEALRTAATGFERQGAAQSSHMKADLASKVEEEKLRAINAMEASTVKLREAEELRADAANKTKGIATRVEGDVASRVEQQRQGAVEAMQASTDLLREAEEPRIEAAKRMTSMASRAQDNAASRIEEQAHEAVEAMEASAEKLHEAREHTLDATKRMAARLGDTLHLGLHGLERGSEHPK